MKCIQEKALHEPLVDIVDGEAVNSVPFVFKEIDINTVKKADLSFAAEFDLVVNRNDYIHAFLAYFDITFSACHKPVKFSTGPKDRPTHWKQTVFYLKNDLMASAGDHIKGRLTCSPNNRNPRDLDISLQYSQESNGNLVASDSLDYMMC